ncbi:nucleoside deaminase [Desulfonema ishimotonii]
MSPEPSPPNPCHVPRMSPACPPNPPPEPPRTPEPVNLSPEPQVDHAEMVALRRLDAMNPDIDRSRITLFCTMEPCLMCYGAILLSGIGTIVYAYEDVMGGGTACDLSALPPLYSDRRIDIVPHVLRRESLELFKAFFENSENSYWQGSLLERYTLEQ